MTRQPPLRRLVAIFAAIALVFAGILGIPAAAGASPSSADITGSVAYAGSVNDGDTVSLYEFPGGGSTTGPGLTTTMSGGTFTFTGVNIPPSSDYAVYIDSTAPGFSGTFSNGTTTVPADGSSAGVIPWDPNMDFGTITMVGNTTVSGVVQPTDSALDGTTVTLTQYNSPGGFGEDVGSGTLSTVPFGGSTVTAFVFPAGVDPSQNYVLTFSPTASGYTDGFATGSVVPPDVGGAGTLEGAVGTMDFGYVSVPTVHTLSGTVTFGGAPVAGVEVDVSPVGYPILATLTSGMTDASGHYTTDPTSPVPSGLPVLVSIAPTGPYAQQFYSDSASPGTATQVVTSGPASVTDMPGFDFHLVSIAQHIDIVAEVDAPFGCGCSGFPTTITHLYLKTGQYWTPVDTQSDVGTTVASFIESNPGDYRLRFTDAAGNWLPVDQSSPIPDTGSGGYADPTTDGCAVDITGLTFGDQPAPIITLLAPSGACGSEPTPPSPPVAPTVHRSSVTRTVTAPTPDVTPTPTPTPTVTASPTPEPTATTQTPSHPASPTGQNLAWIWWVVGALVLLLLVGGALFLFRRRP